MEASSNLEHSSLIPFFLFFFFKQKTAYEMVMSDWSSDVCSSDLSFVGLEPDAVDVPAGAADEGKIGRASCRERVFITV